MTHTVKTYLLIGLAFVVLILAAFVDLWQTIQIGKLRQTVEQQGLAISNNAIALGYAFRFISESNTNLELRAVTVQTNGALQLISK